MLGSFEPEIMNMCMLYSISVLRRNKIQNKTNCHSLKVEAARIISEIIDVPIKKIKGVADALT
jgi:hypothetical protein